MRPPGRFTGAFPKMVPLWEPHAANGALQVSTRSGSWAIRNARQGQLGARSALVAAALRVCQLLLSVTTVAASLDVCQLLLSTTTVRRRVLGRRLRQARTLKTTLAPAVSLSMMIHRVTEDHLWFGLYWPSDLGSGGLSFGPRSHRSGSLAFAATNRMVSTIVVWRRLGRSGSPGPAGWPAGPWPPFVGLLAGHCGRRACPVIAGRLAAAGLRFISLAVWARRWR